jgi:hypothetical protein
LPGTPERPEGASLRERLRRCTRTPTRTRCGHVVALQARERGEAADDRGARERETRRRAVDHARGGARGVQVRQGRKQREAERAGVHPPPRHDALADLRRCAPRVAALQERGHQPDRGKQPAVLRVAPVEHSRGNVSDKVKKFFK